MILHCIGEHLLLRCQWTLQQLNEVGIPVHKRIEMIARLAEALKLDVAWFHALSYVTDPEYLPLVINQLKYLYFLKSKDSDSRLIEFLFSEPLTHCPFQRHQHLQLFSITSDKMREKCETILNSYSASKGVKNRAHIERVWKEEQNTVKTSLETTLTKCYTRFKSTLEYQWERCKGYPATPGNDCYKEYRINTAECSIRLEEIESLTQHAPHLPPPLGDLSNQGSTPDTSIPPYQIAPSERELSSVKSVVAKTVPDISNQMRNPTSSHSPSKQNDDAEEERDQPSSQWNNLFEGGSTPGDKTELPTSDNNEQDIQTLLTVGFEKVMAKLKYLPHLQIPSDGKQTEPEQSSEIRTETGTRPVKSVPEASRQTNDSNTNRSARTRNSLEEPLPLTLDSLESSTSYNLNILQNVLEVEDKQVVGEEKQTDTAAEKKAKDHDDKNSKSEVKVTVKDSAQSSSPIKSSAPLKGIRRKYTRKPSKERNTRSVRNKRKPTLPAQSNQKEKPISPARSKQKEKSISPARSKQNEKPISPAQNNQKEKPISPAQNNQKEKPISPARSNQKKKPISPVRKSTRPRKPKTSFPKPVIRLRNTRRKICDLTTETRSCQTSFLIPTTTRQDSHKGFVQIITEEATASSTPITTAIERTCEVEPKTGHQNRKTRPRRADSGFPASDKKKRKTEEKEVVFNLVSEDEDDLYDPGDLSVDMENDSSISLINVPSQ